MNFKKNHFKCSECDNDRLFSYFAILDNPDKLGDRCYYCQTGTKPTVRNYKKDPNVDERKCIRCRVIRHQDEFLWTSKNGKRTKPVKTCNNCRSVDKALRTKHKSKEDEQSNLVVRKLNTDKQTIQS
jgi:hypothetical protein